MTIDRKAATAAYKERKPAPGIFAIRCAATNAVWVGRAPNLDTIANRIWFTLRHGSHNNRALQAAWSAHGADAFVFEPLEALPDEEHAPTRERQLKTQLAYWAAELGAALV
jgi:hypothetical protein